ncbi:MAG: MerR family transcriptional regulator, partial [Candidatus Nezhaarchaeales archaeon]
LTKRKPRTIVIPECLLAMLSEEAKKVVMDKALDNNQRFKALVEDLHWNKCVSINKLSKHLNVPYSTLRGWMKRLNVKVRDRITALQLANTKHAKRDFDEDDVEKLKLWYLAHTDGSVKRYWQQVLVVLNTPDSYLALLFKEAFVKYGYVGIAPRWDIKGGYTWQLWIYLPLKSYWWLLEKLTLTPVDSDVKLYSALSITIDIEGSLCTLYHRAIKEEEPWVLGLHYTTRKCTSLNRYTRLLSNVSTRCTCIQRLKVEQQTTAALVTTTITS